MALSHGEWSEQKERELEDDRYRRVLEQRRKALQEDARRRRSKVVFEEWLQHKENYERAVQLLERLDDNRRADHGQWFEVAVALNAVERLRGEPRERRQQQRQDKQQQQQQQQQQRSKSGLDDVFFRWSRQGFEFNDVPVAEELGKTFTLNAQEIMQEYAEQMEREGEYVIPSLKYTVPKGKQAAHDKRNLHNPDTKIYNRIYNKLIRTEYARACKEMEERLQGFLARMGDLPRDKAERKALGIMGLNRLAKWVEEDAINRETIEANRKREDKQYALKVHEGFVRKKASMRVRLPDDPDAALVEEDEDATDDAVLRRSKVLLGSRKENATSNMTFAKARNGSVRPVRAKVATSSVDLALEGGASSGKYVYCTNKRDLEKARQQLAEQGHIFKENFKDEDGDALEEEYQNAKQRVSKKDMARKLVLEREEKASEAFEAWAVQKELRTRALEALKFITRPGKTGQGRKQDDKHWRFVGEQLKAIDQSLFGEWADWSKGFRSPGLCKATWDSLTPTACDTCCPSTAVHRLLVKLLNRRGADFAQIFELAVDRQLQRSMASDGRELQDATDEEREQIRSSLELSPKQFRQLMLDSGIKLHSHEVRILTTLFDENGDGRISRREFLRCTGLAPRPGARGETLALLRGGSFCCWEASCHVTGLAAAYEVMPVRATDEGEDGQEGEGDQYQSDFERSDGEQLGLVPQARELPLRLRSGKVRPGWTRRPLPDLETRIRRLLKTGDRTAADFLTEPPASCDVSQWTNEQRQEALAGLEALAEQNRELSETLAVQTDGSPPLAPELSVSYSTEDSLTLAWAPREGSMFPSFYTLETAGFEGSKNHRKHHFEELVRDPPKATDDARQLGRFTWKGLRPGTRYVFRLRAFNGYGPSPFTHATFLTAPRRPLVPVVTALTPTTATLSWGGQGAAIKTGARELRDVFRALDPKGTGAVDRDKLLDLLESQHQRLFRTLDKIPSASMPDASILDMLEAYGESDALSWPLVSGWLDQATNSTNSAAATATAGAAGSRLAKREPAGAFQYTLCRCVSDEEVNFREEGALVKGRTAKETACAVLKGSRWFEEQSLEKVFDLPTMHLTELPEPSSRAAEKPALRVVLPKAKQEPNDTLVGAISEPITHLEVFEQVYVGSDTSVTLAGLRPGASYQFRVIALNTAQGVASRMGAPAIVHMPLEAPPAPRLGKSGVTTDSVHLVWGKPEDKPRRHSAREKDWQEKVQEWVATAEDQQLGGVSDSTLRKMFMRYDRDRSSTLDAAELSELFADLGLASKGPAFLEAARELAGGAGTTVSYAAFAKWWRRRDRKLVLLHRAAEGPRSGKWQPVYRGDKAFATVSGLAPNCRHDFCVQAEEGHASSARSRELTVYTAPETPPQPVVVEVGPKHCRIKWYAGPRGAAKYQVELFLVEELSQKRRPREQGKWVLGLETSATLALLEGLVPDAVYRLRVKALNTKGAASSESLPTQFQTALPGTSLDKLAGRANAANFYCIECTGDIVAGDTILFTERVFADKRADPQKAKKPRPRAVAGWGGASATPRSARGPDRSGSGPAASLSQQSLSMLAGKEQGKEFVTECTIAARVLATTPGPKGTALSLEVLWSTVSHKDCPDQLVPKPGWRLSRLDADLFRFETFRAAWSQESSRWSAEEEREQLEADKA